MPPFLPTTTTSLPTFQPTHFFHRRRTTCTTPTPETTCTTRTDRAILLSLISVAALLTLITLTIALYAQHRRRWRSFSPAGGKSGKNPQDDCEAAGYDAVRRGEEVERREWVYGRLVRGKGEGDDEGKKKKKEKGAGEFRFELEVPPKVYDRMDRKGDGARVVC